VDSRGYELLEAKLGHTFTNRTLIESALTHKSYINENPHSGKTHNQRLEFLGDAALGLATSHMLVERFPALQEGELSMTRAEIVSEMAVAEVAHGIGLGDWLFLGRGEEQTGGRHKPSVLADALEAVIAAVYLDGGYAAAFTVVERLFLPKLLGMDVPPGFTDFKTRLQERAQALRHETPRYKVTAEGGPDHNKIFEVVVTIGGRVYASCGGRSKKEAEQRAAEEALFVLEGEIYPPPEETG
jgi:ribonuclease-3